MKRVIFELEKSAGLIVYPDDISLFGSTEIIGNNIIADYTGELPLVEYVEPALKTVYTRDQFIAIIPKVMVRQIQAAAGTNDDINVWVFNLPMVESIDLNDLPNWFVEGLQGMVTEAIFSQAVMDAFLER